MSTETTFDIDDDSEDVWRQRWDGCDRCGCNWMVVNEDNPEGVPDVSEWEEFPRCLVCGSSLTFGNADEISDTETRHRHTKALSQRLNAVVVDLQASGLDREAEIADRIVAAWRGPSS